MEFSCNIDELDEMGLTFTEYLILFSIYNQVIYKNIQINEKVYEQLERKGYIRKEEEVYVLTDKGFDFFVPPENLFAEFITTFPTRVVDPINGAVRILSPAKSETVAGKKLKHKWDTATKGRLETQKHILACLKAEIQHRTNTNSLQWMRNAETWLNNGTWEDFEYLLNTPSPTISSKDIRL